MPCMLTQSTSPLCGFANGTKIGARPADDTAAVFVDRCLFVILSEGACDRVEESFYSRSKNGVIGGTVFPHILLKSLLFSFPA